MALHNHNQDITDLILSAKIGVVMAIGSLLTREELMSEIKHVIMGCIVGLCSATLVFFYNKLLRKYFPDKKDDNTSK